MNIKFFLVADRDNNNNFTVLYCILVTFKPNHENFILQILKFWYGGTTQVNKPMSD